MGESQPLSSLADGNCLVALLSLAINAPAARVPRAWLADLFAKYPGPWHR